MFPQLCCELLGVFAFFGLIPAFVTLNAQASIQPFSSLLARPVGLKRGAAGVHPRLFFDAETLIQLRKKKAGNGAELWRQAVEELGDPGRKAPDPSDPDLYKSGLDKRKPGTPTQYAMAFRIAQLAFTYAVGNDARYLAAAKEWTLAACEMPIWGYTYNKPNVDLPPAHLLYAVAFAYDLLYDKFSPAERTVIREKLSKQGTLMYDYFKYKQGKRYTYTQNHTWIPLAGLAIAAYAIMDEVPEAANWARLSRAVFQRVIETFGTDGYYYESFHYFGFAFRWVIRYFDAHLSATGESLYSSMRSKLEGMKYYAMHSVLPDGENVFDLADVGDGSINRNGEGGREKLYSEFDIFYRLASVFRDPQDQAAGDYLRTRTRLGTREPIWAFIQRDSSVPDAPLASIPLSYYFKDNDTVFWRSGWDKDATAFVFRCAPPEGHFAARNARFFPDWRENTGHAHPDANSFIIWAKGAYLTGDTGYLGIKQTDDHNTILVNGRGQEHEGLYEMFKDVPNERLDRLRIAEVDAGTDHFYARGEAAAGYFTDLGLKRFIRHFFYLPPGFFVVWDELETEQPSTFTFLLNADRTIEVDGRNAAILNRDAKLSIVGLLPTNEKLEVVDQMVQARGLPGSVSEGDREKRGVQLQTSTVDRERSTEFVHVLIPETKADRRLKNASISGRKLFVSFNDGSTANVCLGGGCGEDPKGNVWARISSRGEKKQFVWQ